MPNYLTAELLELKGLAEPGDGEAEGPESWKFSGLLSVYGNVDGHGDVVVPGAFTKALGEKNVVPLLWQHDADNPIGFGVLTDTPKGLHIEGAMAPEVKRAEEARALMRMGIKMGAPFGLSMGYITRKADREVKDYPGAKRRLTEVKVVEGSPVTFPSNDLSRVTDAKDAPDDDDGVTMPETVDVLQKAAELARKDFRSRKAATLPDLSLAQKTHRAMERVLAEAAGTKAALSFGEIEDALRNALRDIEMAGLSEEEREDKWVWMRDVWSDRVVYGFDGKNWMRTYTLSGTDVMFGARVEVQQAWVPVTETPKSDTDTAEQKAQEAAALDALLASLREVKSNLTLPTAA